MIGFLFVSRERGGQRHFGKDSMPMSTTHNGQQPKMSCSTWYGPKKKTRVIPSMRNYGYPCYHTPGFQTMVSISFIHRRTLMWEERDLQIGSLGHLPGSITPNHPGLSTMSSRKNCLCRVSFIFVLLHAISMLRVFLIYRNIQGRIQILQGRPCR